jgi:hypothetical protein
VNQEWKQNAEVCLFRLQSAVLFSRETVDVGTRNILEALRSVKMDNVLFLIRQWKHALTRPSFRVRAHHIELPD